MDNFAFGWLKRVCSGHEDDEGDVRGIPTHLRQRKSSVTPGSISENSPRQPAVSVGTAPSEAREGGLRSGGSVNVVTVIQGRGSSVQRLYPAPRLHDFVNNIKQARLSVWDTSSIVDQIRHGELFDTTLFHVMRFDGNSIKGWDGEKY